MTLLNATLKPFLKQFYIVVDFEATCWQEDGRRGDEEIIEIGCVKMDRSTHALLDEFQTYVRPRRNPKLSTFCTQLTGITQADVDAAPPFPSALASFVDWIADPARSTFCSWGALDRFLLRQECRFNRAEYPFDDEYINIKPAFSEEFTGRGVSMERALEIAELPPGGRRHSALNDARNAALLWREVLKNQR